VRRAGVIARRNVGGRDSGARRYRPWCPTPRRGRRVKTTLRSTRGERHLDVVDVEASVNHRAQHCVFSSATTAVSWPAAHVMPGVRWRVRGRRATIGAFHGADRSLGARSERMGTEDRALGGARRRPDRLRAESPAAVHVTNFAVDGATGLFFCGDHFRTDLGRGLVAREGLRAVEVVTAHPREVIDLGDTDVGRVAGVSALPAQARNVVAERSVRSPRTFIPGASNRETM
jgi:hypothetical protein